MTEKELESLIEIQCKKLIGDFIPKVFDVIEKKELIRESVEMAIQYIKENYKQKGIDLVETHCDVFRDIISIGIATHIGIILKNFPKKLS